MSLALAAVSTAGAVRADSFTYNVNLTTTPSMPAIYFDITTGSAGFMDASDEFELLTDIEGSVIKARILTSPDDAFPGNGNFFAAAPFASGSGSSVARLAPGSAIGPLLRFSQTNGTLASNSVGFGHWNSLPAVGDIGLEISGTQPTYGWAEITINSNYDITLDAFGWNNSGDPAEIPVSTPEPASIVLLCLGAVGIAAWRNRRRQVTPVPRELDANSRGHHE